MAEQWEPTESDSRKESAPKSRSKATPAAGDAHPSPVAGGASTAIADEVGTEMARLKAENEFLLRQRAIDRRGNNPRVLDEENGARMREIYSGRIAGEHRWRIQLPNFAYYIYFDCETDRIDHAKGLWMSMCKTNFPAAHANKIGFVYMGRTEKLGPAKINERIPLEDRTTTFGPPPKGVLDAVREDN